MNASVLQFSQPPAATLSQACAALALAKAAEHDATQARLAAETAVITLMGELPEEGTTRKDAGEYVAVVTTSIRRSVDTNRLAEVAKDIPEAIGKRLLRWKPELVTRELRYIEANEPALYCIVAQAVEAKPAKPAVKLEPAKEGA